MLSCAKSFCEHVWTEGHEEVKFALCSYVELETLNLKRLRFNFKMLSSNLKR